MIHYDDKVNAERILDKTFHKKVRNRTWKKKVIVFSKVSDAQLFSNKAKPIFTKRLCENVRKFVISPNKFN